MTDHAINFRAIVDRVRAQAGDDPAPVVVDGDGPIDVCRGLFERVDDGGESTNHEFYLSKNAQRSMERRLTGADVDPTSEPFLQRLIRTDVSMPDDAVLYADPDAITLGGALTGDSPVGLGTISSGDDATDPAD